ncbi:cellulose binding domain-containing protein [Actinoplanes sp. NPDC049118]|uniref:cellulose binding domain-containing protein n=1 Tax=Actinoplanes sp. NPDC049118 TaxID=3155769 RepID=UPI0033C04393
MMSSARIAVAVALSAAVLVPASPASASASATATATGATAVFTRVAQWPAGYVGNITVRNDTATLIDGWRVEFDLAAGTRVTSSYSGVFARTGDHYTVRNETWNGTLAPGSSATFGWVAEGQGTPAGCTLNGFDCAGVPADHTAPTRPGPLGFDISAGLTLTWAPSSDDHGPIAYEVYESGQLRATVTDTRYVYSNGPTLPPRIYIFAVRAVDAAGNHSPYAYRSLGQIWRGDEIPAAPSGLRADTPAPGLLRLSWTGPAATSPFVAPPVAGYEVSLDGEPVGQVGDAAIIVPAPPAGAHTFGVRTINAVDRYSAVAELHHPAG